MDSFKVWLETTADIDEKSLISFTGLIRPIIRERLQTEFTKNSKSITRDLTHNFSDAYYGTARNENEAVTIWEFTLSPRPIAFQGKRLPIGSCVLAYQLPSLDDHSGKPKLSQPTPDEKEKLLKGREKFFVDFFRNVVLNDETLDTISNDLVRRIYRTVGNTDIKQGPGAKVVWSSNVTTNGGVRNLGRILIALRLQPKEEKELEKAVETNPASATD